MQGAVHLVALRLAAILCLGLCAGCRTTVDVFRDEREDFTQYRRWDFASRSVPKVDATYGDAKAIDARVARLIERELEERGFQRSATEPDFLVSYHLALRRREVIVEEPSAPYLLSSMNASPSYWIEGGSRKQRQVHEDLRLQLGISEARDRRRTWRGVLMRTLVNAGALPLEDAVATLLERFAEPPER